jgi:hypothetical protein
MGETLTTSTEYELLQIRDLAANYSDRQGLRIVPMAVAILLQAVPMDDFGWAHLLLLAAGVFGYRLVGRYYRRRYGHVEEHRDEPMAAALQTVVFMLLLLPCMSFDLAVVPPVFLSGIVIAVWLIFASWPARAVRVQYAAVGISLILVALAPMLGVSQESTARTYGVVFGAAMLVSGIIDHLRFIHLMKRPQEDAA